MDFCSTGIVWDNREPPPPTHADKYDFPLYRPETNRYADYVHCNSDTGSGVAGPKSLATNVMTELNRSILPAACVSLAGRIAGDIAEVTVRQLFWNDSDTPIKQGSYTFPMPAGCTITSFSCRLGNDRKLVAKAFPREQAQDIFRSAVAAHRYAALLEQNTPEIFTSALGNIPADTRVKIEITYVTLLKPMATVDSNIVSLTIPTYLADRYGKRPESLKGIGLGSQSDEVLLRIEVIDIDRSCSISSDSHEVLVNRITSSSSALCSEGINAQESTVVTLKENRHWFDTDFVLSIETALKNGAKCPRALLEVHPSLPNQAAMIINIPPTVIESDAAIADSGEVIFLIDRSGSMDDKMENLKSAMYSLLKAIPSGRHFNIWSFGSTYHSLWPCSQTWSETTLKAALKHVHDHFIANMEGTELISALKAVISSRVPTIPCDIIVVTDGEVWHLEETLTIVDQANSLSGGAMRFFSLGIGAHVSHALVDGIARRGGGSSEVIPQAGRHGWNDRVVAILRKALTVHGELELSLGGIKAVTSPSDFKSIKPLQASRVFLLLQQSEIPGDQSDLALTISIGKQIIEKIGITKLTKPDTIIHKLSARAILQDLELESDYSAFSQRPDLCQGVSYHIPTGATFAETLACKYSLASKWTSLCLVQDEKDTSKDTFSVCRRQEIRIDHVRDGLLQPKGGIRSLQNQALVNTVTRLPINPGLLKPVERTTGTPHTFITSHINPDFILRLRSQQSSDGSFSNPAQESFVEIKEVFNEVRLWISKENGLETSAAQRIANTVVIMSILEKEANPPTNGIRELMENALAYLITQIPDSCERSDLLGYSRRMVSERNGVAYAWKINTVSTIIS
ncbi:hypothetical protein NPX13_g3910 [Xylaria arbuscula]|uniref:VIT domain-containing protein n=1 Tax=Xylaria arbuscula TaxID=114810 RepID=A0A9W8NGF8_9PEZI|nr:hypothetical protein NPX13_g3910 [Xylaria arbuscula]